MSEIDKSAPRTNRPKRLRPGYIPLNEEMLDALRQEQERTGVSIYRLLAGARDAPQNLSSNVLQRWFSGNVGSVHAAHYEYVRRRWQNVPDDTILTITPELRAELAARLSQSGYALTALMRRFPPEADAPAAATVRRWRTGEIATVRQSHWNLVMSALGKGGEPQ